MRSSRLVSTAKTVFVLLAFSLVLAGCGNDAPPPPTPDPATQADAPAAPTADFVLIDAGSETWNGRPALRLRFSQPLVGEQPFDQLIVVADANGAEQSGGWVLDDDRQTLLFPYVQGDKTYSVTLKGAISAVDGRTVAPQPAREVYSGNLAPTVGFASQGSVLPARGSEGLPVIAVNVTDVDVEFLRVREKNYSQFFATFLGQSPRSYWQLSELSAIADSVYATRFALEGAPNQRTVSFLPVQTLSELREPGLYFALMKRPGTFDGSYETSYFYVSDLGLHARVQNGTLWVHTASLASGSARGSVAVQVIDRKGNTLASGSTDSDGDARLAYTPNSEHVLIARDGDELALIPFNQPALDLSEFSIAGRKQTAQDVYAWSGRDLFRPGEPLQVSALLRDFDGRPLPNPQPLFATLRQPDGRAVSTLQLDPEALGYYNYARLLPEDGATGRWTVEFRLDPSTPEPDGRFAFRIEEFLPERLKLALDSSAERLAPGEPLPLAVDGDYLYGAPAAGNRFTAELIYRPALHPVPAFKDYFFGDPTQDLPKEPQEAIDTKLGDDGTLNEDIALLPDAAPVTAPVDVLVAGSVFESGGRAVRRSLTRTIWPADALVGVRPLFDHDDGANSNSDAAFEIVRSDAAGTSLAAAALQVKLIRELRNYHWTWTDGSGWSTDYTRRYETVDETTLALAAGTPGRYSARVEWGEYRLEITDPDTGLTMRYPFTAGYSWNDDNRGVDARPDKVKLSLDKDGYAAGDTAVVTITPPYDGQGVLLVESDTLLFRTEIEARAGATVSIPISADMARHDVYITALVFRPAGTGEGMGPKRAIGIAHLPIARGNRDVALTLTAPERTRPGEQIAVTVDAPGFAGQQAFVVVEAVDLGIINLTNYAVPDASDYFLAQRGLGVEAWDIYGRVIETLEGVRAKLRFGGDAALSALPQARRPTAKVQTVALHHAPVAFDAQGKATVTFTAPDFNGTLRVAALAYSAQNYGRSSVESIVRAPLVLEVSTPRAMAPGDSSSLTVDLHNLSGAKATYRVSATSSGPLSIPGAVQTVELEDNQRRTIGFALKALAGYGVGKFSVSAESAGATLKRDFEIVVRPAWSTVRRSNARVIDTAQTLNFGSNLFDGLYPESAKALISVSAVPPLPFAAVVDGLIGYPYGCIEQTSSRLWPLVWLDDATARKLGIPALEPAKRKAMLDAGFARISAMQLENGQFSFWPGDGYAQPQMTAYVADLLLTAKDNGLDYPQAVLDKALERLNEDLLTGGDGYYNYEHSDHLRFAANAYAGYVLARANRAPLGTLRSLYDNQRGNSLTALPLVQLGLALQLQGDAQRGQAAVEEALQKNSDRPQYLGDYGSDVRDEALLIALLHENKQRTPALDARVIALARNVRTPERQRYWFSTQEQLAIFRLGRAVLGENARGLQGELRVGETVEALDGRPLVSREAVLADLRAGVSVVLQGDGPFWVSEDVVGTPTTAPAPKDDPIRVRRSWYTTDGTLFTGSELTEGDTLIAKLTVEAKEQVPDALVVDLLPAGIEIENLALGDRGALGDLVLDGITLNQREYAADVQHEEFRDDRYVAAVKLWAGSPAHLFYLVRAVSPGTFVVPPPTVEDMYRPQIGGVGEVTQKTITVVSP
ncbi:alpha-2-macroglobulin family protein [Chiayiivirga flava]|uniref:Alpha-2-macroglobulin n=1 Tax=Chiayiivirga flava TaxID=659595 RepID=A0A7W8FXU7_9GAMM|nr:alpha-2-macroglobulin [Chiayiivirga flava]MBB5206707.1 hypothetical protein [Chiayiivirga flava]